MPLRPFNNRVGRSSYTPWADWRICGACVSACSLGERAIRFDFAKFYRPVVEAGCAGCGVCVEVCPHPAKAVRVVPKIEREAA